jgi:hypothetical protein
VVVTYLEDLSYLVYRAGDTIAQINHGGGWGIHDMCRMMYMLKRKMRWDNQ